MNTRAQLTGLLMGILAAPLAEAVTVYKITDAQGHVTYQNEPPAAGAQRVEVKQIDPAHNTLAFERPRAVGAPQGGGGNTDMRAIDELIRRSFMAGAASAAGAGKGADAGSSVVIVNGGSRNRPALAGNAGTGDIGPDGSGTTGTNTTGTGTTGTGTGLGSTPNTSGTGNVTINGGTLFNGSGGTTNPNFGTTGTPGSGTNNQSGTTGAGTGTNPNTGAFGAGGTGGTGTGNGNGGFGGTTGPTGGTTGSAR